MTGERDPDRFASQVLGRIVTVREASEEHPQTGGPSDDKGTSKIRKGECGGPSLASMNDPAET